MVVKPKWHGFRMVVELKDTGLKSSILELL